MTRAFFDTNVLIYLFDNRYPDKKAKAQDVFNRAVSSEQAHLSTQVLQEFYVTVTRKLPEPLPFEEAETQVRDFAKLPLVRVDAPLIVAAIARGRALSLSLSLSLSLWDALIIEAALKAGAERLLTEDLQDGQVIDGLRVENPFL